jgi:hypothetical protein
MTVTGLWQRTDSGVVWGGTCYQALSYPGSYQEIFNGNGSDAIFRSIPAGTYAWSDCLIPQNGGSYLQESEVKDSSGVIVATIDSEFRVVSSGTYTWGSELVISVLV